MQEKLEQYRDHLLNTIETHQRRFESALVLDDMHDANAELENIREYEQLLKRLETYEV